MKDCNAGSRFSVGDQRSTQHFPVKIKLSIPDLVSLIPPSSQDICTQPASSLKQAFKDNEITYGRKSVDIRFLKYQERVDSIMDIGAVHGLLQAKATDKHGTGHTLCPERRMNTCLICWPMSWKTHFWFQL